jgi:hypothetical protein
MLQPNAMSAFAGAARTRTGFVVRRKPARLRSGATGGGAVGGNGSRTGFARRGGINHRGRAAATEDDR